MLEGGTHSPKTPSCCEQRMDNAAFVNDERPKNPGQIEMEEMKDVPMENNTKIPQHMCNPDICHKAYQQYMDKNRGGSPNPQDNMKMFFLLGTLGLFIIWLILYTILSKLIIF